MRESQDNKIPLIVSMSIGVLAGCLATKYYCTNIKPTKLPADQPISDDHKII